MLLEVAQDVVTLGYPAAQRSPKLGPALAKPLFALQTLTSACRGVAACTVRASRSACVDVWCVCGVSVCGVCVVCLCVVCVRSVYVRVVCVCGVCGVSVGVVCDCVGGVFVVV